MDCGKKFPSCAMDFDHVRGKKLFGVNNAAVRHHTLAALKRELAKCELVCSNCHRVRTESRRRKR